MTQGPFILLQLIIYGYIIFILSKSFQKGAERKERFSIQLFIVQILLTILMISCFAVHYDLGSPFKGSKYFSVYEAMSITSLLAFWLYKAVNFEITPRIKLVLSWFVGLLFWISLFTAIKFLPFLPLTLFPVFGLLLAAPFLILVMVISELKYQSELNKHIKTWKSIAMGLVILVSAQLTLNLISNSSWALVELFIPNSDAFYF